MPKLAAYFDHVVSGTFDHVYHQFYRLLHFNATHILLQFQTTFQILILFFFRFYKMHYY